MNKRELQKEETLHEILKVSSQLFQEVGFEKTTIQMIADQCGLSKGALYHHFKSKEEVLERISRNYYETAIAVFLPLSQEEGKSMKERLKNIMTMARQSQMNTAISTYVREEKEKKPSVENALLEKIFNRDSEKIYLEVMAPLLTEGKAAGECTYVGSGEVVARFIHSLDTGMGRQLNEILSSPEDSEGEQKIKDVIFGFTYALSQILDIPQEEVEDITLAQKMLDQYREILQMRRKD